MAEESTLIADMAEVALAPGAVSKSLRPRIEEFDLWRNVEEMREHGATVVTDAVPLDLLDELRAVIHEEIERLGSHPGEDWPCARRCRVLHAAREPGGRSSGRVAQDPGHVGIQCRDGFSRRNHGRDGPAANQARGRIPGGSAPRRSCLAPATLA